MADQPLSPAAQAIRQINGDLYDQPVLSVIAAAILILADHVIDERCQNESERRIYDRLRRVAAELEGADA